MIPLRQRVTTALLPIAIPVVLLVGCTKTPVTPAAASVGVSHSVQEPPVTRDAVAGATMSAAPSAPSGHAPDGSPRRVLPSEFGPTSSLEDVHFDFDKYDIRRDNVRILDANARWMKANLDAMILIEGHADERGTDEYNLALGDRRAKAVMTHLVAQGVLASRLTMISYGEERPVCSDHHEACWAKNRRAHFMVRLR